MRNISFDNPWLLLLAIPLVLAILIPFFIIRNKDNRSIFWSISVGIHITVILLSTLAAAGLNSTQVLTKTTVYVVADVSYSSERNLDLIDDYIEDIEESLPVNSKLGVVCFGRNSTVLTSAGRRLRSVSEAKVDDSSTDIVQALTYTEGLFPDDTLKRIILITDGNDNVNKQSSMVASTVERLTEDGIKVDTVFLNNSADPELGEVQLSGVQFNSTAFLGNRTQAKFILQSAAAANVQLRLESKPEGAPDEEYTLLEETVIGVEAGLNTIPMDLISDVQGTYDYRATVLTDKDYSTANNQRLFTQEVVGKTRILLVCGSKADENTVKVMYGNNADIDSYLVTSAKTYVPFTLEDLVEYDEIVLSGVDVRNINNSNAFVDTVEKVVAQFGKSLIAIGDLKLQLGEDDRAMKKLAELLPVDYGKTAREGKLYTIVLDVSHSMFTASKFTTATRAAANLISLLNDEDYVSLITFSGKVEVQPPTQLKYCREDLLEYVNGLSTDHGTDLAMGLEEALKIIVDMNLRDNQVMVISDGFSFEDEVTSLSVARQIFNQGSPVSCINTYIPADGEGGRATLKSVAGAGRGGKYYEISRPEDVSGIVFGSVADEITESIVLKSSTVNINRYKDYIANGFTSFSNVSGYIQCLEKYDATVSLTVNYEKSNGYVYAVPLYAYRSHGNGRVSCFTSSISGTWISGWSANEKEQFLHNLFVSNTPKERIDYPYTVNMERTDFDTYLEIVPSVMDPAAKTVISITQPNGKVLTRELTFDSQKYFYTFDSSAKGIYRIDISYNYGDESYSSTVIFEVPYTAEYDAFANFDKSVVYEFMRGNGGIYEGEIPDLSLKDEEISTYKMSFAIPLLIAAACLFVADVVVRKLRLKKRGPKVNKAA